MSTLPRRPPKAASAKRKWQRIDTKHHLSKCIAMKILVRRFMFLFRMSLTVLVVVSVSATYNDESARVVDVHVADRFKAPNDQTDYETAQKWKYQDEQLWRYVNEHVPAVLDHTGSSAFDEHLKGVQAVLRYWDAPTHLSNAGLFHSIYGTEGFQGFSLPLSERTAIQSLIGNDSEWLCFVFCMVDRYTFDSTVFDWVPSDVGNTTATYTLKSRPELGRFDIVLSKVEWLDFVELTLADWLEQVEGAASKPSELFLWKTGEAYAYRRRAYKKMTQILSMEKPARLSIKPSIMYEAVMATESIETRHLVQDRTPPVSDPARRAIDALRAVGTPIPMDLSPQSSEAYRIGSDEL